MRKRLTALIIAFALLLASAALASASGMPDYIEAIKVWKPYMDDDIDVDIKTVLERYILSCEWTQEQQDNGYFVDASGQFEEEAARMRFAVTVSNSGISWEIQSFTLDEEAYENEVAEGWLKAFFDTYEASTAMPSYGGSDKTPEKNEEPAPSIDADAFEAVLDEHIIEMEGDYYSDCVYALYDIDANGVPELLTRFDEGGDEIIRLHAYADGKVHFIDEFWPRRWMKLDGNGNLYSLSQDGTYQTLDAMRLSDDGMNLVIIETWEKEDSDYAHYSATENESISESEYYAALDKVHEVCDSFMESLDWRSIYDTIEIAAPSAHEEARKIVLKWLAEHADVDATISGWSTELYTVNGQEYYMFYLGRLYWLDILVDSETGNLFCRRSVDEVLGDENIIPLDEYYRDGFSSDFYDNDFYDYYYTSNEDNFYYDYGDNEDYYYAEDDYFEEDDGYTGDYIYWED